MSRFLDNILSDNFLTLLFLSTAIILILFIVIAIMRVLTISQKEKTKRVQLIASILSRNKLLEILEKKLETEILCGNDAFVQIINIIEKILK